MSKGFIKKIIKHLPKSIRYPIFRNSLHLPKEIPKNLKFKLVSNEIEFFDALKVLHDCYVDRGYMNPDPLGIRITPYHLLPSTLMAIATWDDKVVATMTVVRDNKLGLPMDNIFNLSSLREQGEVLAEVSALAIHPDFRWSNGNLFHCLIRYLWTYSREWYGIDRYVIAVHPTMADFYEAFYAFEPITDKNIVGKYDFANGAPAVALSIPVPSSIQILKEVYSDKLEEKNIHAFMTKEKFDTEIYPEKKYYVMADSFLSERKLSSIVHQIDDLESRFSPEVRDGIAHVYGCDSYHKLMDSNKNRRENEVVRFLRFDSKCPTHFIASGSDQQLFSFEMAHVINLSRNGLRLRLNEKQLKAIGHEISLKIKIGPKVNSYVTAKPVWFSDSQSSDLYSEVGLQITSEDKNWTQLHQSLDVDKNPLPGSHDKDLGKREFSRLKLAS
jgi:hypothetical protein